MEPVLEIDQTFEKINYTVDFLPKGEYEYCTFINCDFSNSDLSNIQFLECKFVSCNLSLAKLTSTALRGIVFTDCKMLGLHFENCNPFGFAFGFENCSLNHASFYQTKPKKTLFKNCTLIEVDFTDSDISNSTFDHCDLSKAVFENTNIQSVNFRTSFNYAIDLEKNKHKKAKFSSSELAGLLAKYDIDISV